jgi:hypothetical protein
MSSARSTLLVLPFALLLLACNDDGKAEGDASASVGDGDGDGDGAGDGDGDPTGDGDGDGGCTLGELNCACSNGQCFGDLECAGGMCVDPCTPGELGCGCSNGQCFGSLECSGDICIDPNCNPGSLGCQCSEGLCLGDLECSGNVCVESSGDGDGDGNANPCPLPNQLLCNGNCIDVMDDDNNCGACGKVCPKNSQDGGCSEGACLPFWGACFQPVVDYNNCNEACAAEGRMCVYGGCNSSTYKTYDNSAECALNGTNGAWKWGYTCEQQALADPQIEAVQCCCNVI